jgi:choline dehydrogenase-like flavoprotein
MGETTAEGDLIENAVIGSGPAAFAVAMALKAHGARSTVIDVGYGLEPGKEEDVVRLGARSPEDWDEQTLGRLYPPPAASAKGVERRLLFGSDFPYRIPRFFSARMEDCDTELSHGLGGFGNVWGAAVMPYSASALRDWPIAKQELDRSYRNVLKYIPVSAEQDGLARMFPLAPEAAHGLERPRRIEALLDALERRRDRLARRGVEFGRARVAVDPASCRSCGRCLEGCIYGAIFNPRLRWSDLAETAELHTGHYALEFKETADCAEITTIKADDGAIRKWKAKRVYLAAGYLGTTRLIARSLGLFNRQIRIRDSQYFFFPLISYRAIREDVSFSLAEVFLEIFNESITDRYMHFQLYGMNSIFERALRKLLPAPIPLGPIANRMYMMQGFLPSEDSGHLTMEIEASGERHDQVVIRGNVNPRARVVARKAQAALRRELIGFGLIPPAYLQLVPPGRSFHAGGSFPMGGGHPIYSSDVLGRPAGLKRVHIVDSANFPTIASSTIAYTIMANADRIVRACADMGAA